MGCFTSKLSHDNQPSCKEEKWWKTNDDKITASALAESLFCYPSELFDTFRCREGSVENSLKRSLLLAFRHALRNVGEQPHTVEGNDLSIIKKIMKSTGRFLRPIDVLLPKLLADHNVSRALGDIGLDGASVKKEFYKLHYRNAQKSTYKAVRKHTCDFLLDAAGRTNATVSWAKEIDVLELMVCQRPTLTRAAIVVGELGVDKVAVIEGLAQSMLRGRVLPLLLDRSIVALRMDKLVFRGNGAKVCRKIIEDVWRELETSERKTSLFIDNIENFFIDASTRMLLRYKIRNHRVQCIGTVMRDQYDIYIEGDAGLYRKCDTIYVSNPEER